MGKEVGTSRQNIEHLETKPGITPHYIVKLASVMGTTVDDLLNGRFFVAVENHQPLKTTPEATTASAQQITNLEDGVEVVLQAIASSEHKGSDALAGTLVSLSKDPLNPMFKTMFVQLIGRATRLSTESTHIRPGNPLGNDKDQDATNLLPERKGTV